MHASLTSAVLASLAGSIVAAPGCFSRAQCAYTLQYNGKPWVFEARQLCNRDTDYTFQDDQGHNYYAQICGIASKRCNPEGYNTEYEYGAVVQSWGTPPIICDWKCIEKGSDPVRPACCTEDCSVVAVGAPTVSWINGDPTKGVQLDYQGETPRANDPYPCDIVPGSGYPPTYYPRTTHMQFYCDPLADGFARLYQVIQNPSDDCDYTLKFKTSAACAVQPLSPGWAFIIAVATLLAVYLAGAVGMNYQRTKTWGLPEAHLAAWGAFSDLMLDGLVFLLSGGKKKGVSGGGYGGMGGSQGAEGKSLYDGGAGGESSSTTTASPYQG